MTYVTRGQLHDMAWPTEYHGLCIKCINSLQPEGFVQHHWKVTNKAMENVGVTAYRKGDWRKKTVQCCRCNKRMTAPSEWVLYTHIYPKYLPEMSCKCCQFHPLHPSVRSWSREKTLFPEGPARLNFK